MDKPEVIELLQSKRINPTSQRVEIAMLLFARPQHLCAEQVIDTLHEKGTASVSKATVYNTLKLFSRHGLLHELCVDSSRVYYDSNTSQHHHIYNVDTGELWDVTTELDIPSIPVPSLPEGTTPLGVDLIYRVKGNRTAG